MRFVSELGVKSGHITWGPLVQLARINFLHFAIVLFVVSLLLLAVVSLLSARLTERNLSIFVSSAGVSPEAITSPGRRRANVGLSPVLAAIVLALWACFSPWVFGGAS